MVAQPAAQTQGLTVNRLDTTLDFDPQFTRADSYHSPCAQSGRHVGPFSRLFPSLTFYLRLSVPVAHLCGTALWGDCHDGVWVLDSARVARALEASGCPLHVEGMEHITASDKPCVFVANHMSTLETFVLPSIIRPRRPVTFVVKDSLMRIPGFAQALGRRNPVVVGRKNPREDLQTVLTEGVERLRGGVSVIVFPQSTRTTVFNPAKFNTIGIKLAKRAGVPVVPLALLTDAWAQGKHIKDFGPIRHGQAIHFHFHPPMDIHDQGKEEHRYICEFIEQKLKEWRAAP